MMACCVSTTMWDNVDGPAHDSLSAFLRNLYLNLLTAAVLMIESSAAMLAMGWFIASAAPAMTETTATEWLVAAHISNCPLFGNGGDLF